jgi:hypothetical protein
MLPLAFALLIINQSISHPSSQNDATSSAFFLFASPLWARGLF